MAQVTVIDNRTRPLAPLVEGNIVAMEASGANVFFILDTGYTVRFDKLALQKEAVLERLREA